MVEEMFPGDQAMLNRVRGGAVQPAGKAGPGESVEPERGLRSIEDAIAHISQNDKELLDRLGDLK